MRTLDGIVSAVRTNETYTEDELVYAVVAFDVLLAQLDLSQDHERLLRWMTAATMDPREYAGEANDPANQEAVRWYKAMHDVELPTTRDETDDNPPSPDTPDACCTAPARATERQGRHSTTSSAAKTTPARTDCSATRTGALPEPLRPRADVGRKREGGGDD